MRLNMPREINIPELRNTSSPPKNRMFRLAASAIASFSLAQMDATRLKTNTAMSAIRSGFSSSEYSAGSFRAIFTSQTYPTPYAGKSKPSKNSQFMFNPFRKSLVAGASKPNGIGLAAPISIDPISMHRHGASFAHSPLMVQHEPVIDRLDVIVGRVIERLVRQVYRSIKEGVCNFFAHARIVVRGQGCGYPYFPIVHFVHASTLCLGIANKNVRGASA